MIKKESLGEAKRGIGTGKQKSEYILCPGYKPYPKRPQRCCLNPLLTINIFHTIPPHI